MELPPSKQRLLNFDLAQLPRDINGMPDGPDYRPFLTVDDMRAHRNVRVELQGVWSGRPHSLAADGERRVFMDLEANPHIISVREGYPFFPPDVLEDILAGRPIARKRVMTVDFIVTLSSKNFDGPLRYQGLYLKPKSVAATPGGKRRKGREQKALEQIGWTWSPMNIPSNTRVSNLEKLREWAKAGPIDSVSREAAELSALLYKTTSTKDLDPLLRMLGRRLGISSADQYFVFAAAFYLGYVSVAQEAELTKQAPLVLARPARNPTGVFVHG